MTKAIRSSATVLAGLWVGALFCLGFVVAPYLFALAARGNPSVPDSGVAAALIGPLLDGSDVSGLVLGAALIAALAFLRSRDEVPMGGRYYLPEVVLGVATLCAAVNYWGLSPRIRALQGLLTRRYGAFRLADKADPLFQQFQGMHRASTGLFTAGFLAALVALVCMTQFRSRKATGASPAGT
jgi:hypothetical protein